MSTVLQPAEQRVILDGVRWSTYLALVEEGDNHRGRMTYDQGVLEIMSPGLRHENVGRLLGRMVETFTEALGIDIVSAASTTFKREDFQRGFEADEAYYLQNASAVAGKDQLDLAIDPPPDLAIEVDVSKSSINKLPLFHALGVPEIWRCVGDKLEVHVRAESQYEPSQASHVLPSFPLWQSAEAIARRSSIGETQLIREFRQWVLENLAG